MKHPPRKVGLFTCVCLVAATMVGNGVYTSLGMQLSTISSGFTILVLWAIGGLCALCGALSYAELASQMPHSGGEYYYLSKLYHPSVGMMAGVVSQIAGCIGPIALASMAFGTYLQAVFPQINPLCASLVLVTVVTLFHLVNLEVSALFQDLTTGLKLLLIAALCFCGFRYAALPMKILLPSKLALKELLQPSSGVTLLFCYYSYSGWNAATYIADEVMTSQKTVGRSLIIGALLVMVIYLMMNAIFLLAVPVEELKGVLDVGHIVATHLLGPQGGRILSLFIAAGLVASVSAMTIVGPRIMEMMGKDLTVLHWFGRVSKENIPVRATLFQYVLILFLLVTASFKMVLVSTQFALISCELLSVLSVIRLRKKNAAVCVTMKGFKCPFYPVPQLFFALVSIIALTYTAATNWLEALLGFSLMGTSLLLYFFIQRKTDHRYSI